MQILRKSLLFCVFIGLSAMAFGEKLFEGSITFIRKSYYDTTELRYLIKNNMIRVDEYDSDSQRIKSLLVNLEEDRVLAIDPQRKRYRPLHVKSAGRLPDSSFQIVKTGNFKVINGKKCFQWRVKNRKMNSEIAYWVTNTKFEFFHELINLLKRTERNYLFFEKIPSHKGYFPMLTIERTLVRDERERIVVDKIRQQKLQEDLFRIPDDYTRLRFSQQIR